MIICVPPGILTGTAKGQLTKKGYIIIETDEPAKVKVITSEHPTEVHDYYLAALKALKVDYPTNPQQVFVNDVYSRLKQPLLQEENPKEPASHTDKANVPTVLKEPIKPF